MAPTLLDRAVEIEQLDTIEEIWVRTTATLARHGLPHAIYITVDCDGANPLVMTNVPTVYDLIDPAEDPFLAYACDSYDLMRTGPEYLSTHEMLTTDERVFISAASDCGFRAGLGIPMRLRGSQRYGGFNIGCGLSRRSAWA